MSTRSEDYGARAERVVFELFVAGDEPHSRAARVNLTQICESHFEGRYEIRVVDVFESFDAALENNIFLTPAVIVRLSGSCITIFGNLGDKEEVLKTLALESQ